MGGGIGMENTCNSMADSCQYMTKTTSLCKVISLKLIKINEKKKKIVGADRAAGYRVATSIQFVKNTESARHNVTTIRQGLPLYAFEF